VPKQAFAVRWNIVAAPGDMLIRTDQRESRSPLFERRSKGMIATPIGEAFVRRANAILNDVRRFCAR
jgi:hypothetical protein